MSQRNNFICGKMTFICFDFQTNIASNSQTFFHNIIHIEQKAVLRNGVKDPLHKATPRCWTVTKILGHSGPLPESSGRAAKGSFFSVIWGQGDLHVSLS